MKQVNLLPKAVRRRAISQKTLPFVVVAVIIAMAGVGLGWVILSQQVKVLQDKVTTRQEADKAKAASDAANQKELAVSTDLTNRVTQINTVGQTEVDWRKFFQLIASLTPKDIYLTNYSLATVQGVMTLHLTGQAPSNVSFATFVQSLGGDKSLKNPKVDGYTYNAGKGTVGFSISAQTTLDQIGYTTSKTP